jgi:hypothetical protein
MSRTRLLVLALISIGVGCSYDDGKWSFRPTDLFFSKKPKTRPANGADYPPLELEKLQEQGYGFRWDTDKQE